MRVPSRLFQYLLKRCLVLCVAILVPYWIFSTMLASPTVPFPVATQRRHLASAVVSDSERGATSRQAPRLRDDEGAPRPSSTQDRRLIDNAFLPDDESDSVTIPRVVEQERFEFSSNDTDDTAFDAPSHSFANETERNASFGAALIEYERGDETPARLPLCPATPPGLRGKMKQDVLLVPTIKEADIVTAHPELRRGGAWKPRNCRARYKVAVIIPFRDRQSHLNRLVEFLIPMLERQQLDFRFIVTEQYGHDLFNKGKIMNAAFTVAERLGVDCVIYHDVDLFPQDDRCLYWCPPQPLHLGAYVNTLGYELWYNYLAGGVVAMRMEHYRLLNGYSNHFWAWGGEDDDMGYRILAQNLSILRPDRTTGKFTMLKHIKRTRTAPKMIYQLLKTSNTRWKTDGLRQQEWKILKVMRKPLYYHIFVDVGTPPPEWRTENKDTKA